MFKHGINKYIASILLAITIFAGSGVFSARTEGIWQELGTYMTTTFPDGRNILINGSNKYLNFGTFSGSSGYGIRDNAGTMEFKNSGGSWTGLGGGGGGGSVNSVSNSDGSIIFLPTTGAVVGSLNPIQVDGSAFTTVDFLNRQLWAGGAVTYDWSTSTLYPGQDIAFPNSFDVLNIGSDPSVSKSGLPLRLSWRTDGSSNGWLQFDDSVGNLQVIRANINADSVLGSSGSFSTLSGGTISGSGTGITGVPIDAGTTGTLPISRGGTNATSFGANRLIYQNAGNTAFTSTSTFTFDGTNMGIGTASPSGKLNVEALTEQLRLAYNSSNYVTQTVSSAGLLSWQTTAGATAGVYTLTPHGAGGAGTNRTLSFGTAWNNAALWLYTNGAGARYGWGMTANQMQFFSPTVTGDSVTFNKGGDLQLSNANEYFRFQQYAGATGAGMGMGNTAYAPVTPHRIDFQGVSATGGTAGVENILRFSRIQTGGVSYPEAFAIGIGRYSSSGLGPDTRIDFSLKSIAATDYTTDAGVMSLNSNKRVLIGMVGAAQAHLDVIGSSTIQFRSGYDASNYWTASTTSTGITTFNAVGAGSSFIFSDDASVPDEAYAAGWDGSLEVPTKNAVYDKIQTITPTPDYSARVYQTAVTSLTTSWVTIPFAAENFDTDTMHDNVTNNSRITFTTAGKYQVGCQVSVTNNSVVGARIRANGSTVIARQVQGNSAAVEGANATTIYVFTAGQYVECQGYASTQNSTGDADTHMWASLIAL